MELNRTWGVASVLFLVVALGVLMVMLARPVKFVPADLQFEATSAPGATPALPAAPAAPLATAPAAPVSGAPASAVPAATVVPTVAPSSNPTAAPRLTTPPTAAPSDPGSMNTFDPIGVGDPPSGLPKFSIPPKGSSGNGP